MVSWVLARKHSPGTGYIRDVEEAEQAKDERPQGSKDTKDPKSEEGQVTTDPASLPVITVQSCLIKARSILEQEIGKMGEGGEPIREAQQNIDKALKLYEAPLARRLSRVWSVLFYIGLAGLVQIFFIEIYCRWHGASFLSLDLYSAANIALLSTMTFVGGATTMSVAAEVLMWSSLGVWAQGAYEMANTFLKQDPHFPFDVGNYIGRMVRNTSVAAVVVIILRLTKFSVFGVSLDSTSPLAFDATIGLSFMLGFFGEDAYRIISSLRDRLVEGVVGKKESSVTNG